MPPRGKPWRILGATARAPTTVCFARQGGRGSATAQGDGQGGARATTQTRRREGSQKKGSSDLDKTPTRIKELNTQRKNGFRHPDKERSSLLERHRPRCTPALYLSRLGSPLSQMAPRPTLSSSPPLHPAASGTLPLSEEMISVHTDRHSGARRPLFT